MSSKKNLIFLGVIIVFLVLPIVPQQKTYANYSIREITNDSNDFTDKNNLVRIVG
ncbi:MAG: hypothetical protein GPJ51_06150 [Candidatus Heimdallarchaeota archaeon]|nr:hypothetical protein [Candidatus Heimdallarchaeota archaeon]